MTGCGSRVGERAAGGGQKGPVVAAAAQGELQNAHCCVVTHFDVCARRDRGEAIQAFAAAGPDGDLPDAERGIGSAVGLLWCPALIVVVVALGGGGGPAPG